MDMKFWATSLLQVNFMFTFDTILYVNHSIIWKKNYHVFADDHWRKIAFRMLAFLLHFNPNNASNRTQMTVYLSNTFLHQKRDDFMSQISFFTSVDGNKISFLTSNCMYLTFHSTSESPEFITTKALFNVSYDPVYEDETSPEYQEWMSGMSALMVRYCS